MVNTLLILSVLFFAAAMGWTYFAVRGDTQTVGQQVGIGGGPDTTVAGETTFRNSFLKLLPEHGTFAAVHLSNLYDGKDISVSAKNLEDNAYTLADLVGQIGTPADRAIFLRMFRGHISEYENYTNARKNNNQEGMNNAKENLRMHAMEFGRFANKIMPSMSEQRGTALMNEHGQLTLAIVDAHAANKTSEKLNAMKEANIQAVTFANELAAAAEQSN